MRGSIGQTGPMAATFGAGIVGESVGRDGTGVVAVALSVVDEGVGTDFGLRLWW